MLSSAHAHRSYQNLKAYLTASDICADMFWQSRSFPSSLYRSLTAPLRDKSFRVYQSVLRVWRHRHDPQRARLHVELALDEIWMLRQYVLRAQAEEVLEDEPFQRVTKQIEILEVQVRRLPDGIIEPA